MSIEITYVIVVLIAVLLFKVYDALRHIWQTKKTNTLSIAWHSVAFALNVYISVAAYILIFGFTTLGWLPVVWLAIIAWWLVDIVWNKTIGVNTFYAGDGTGSVIEIAFKRIADKLGTTLHTVMIVVKSIALILAILLTLI